MYYRETITTGNGVIELTAENFTAPTTPVGEVELSVWGRVDGEGNPIYPPRSTGDKSVAKYGGVNGYLQSKEARQLFFYVPIGAYIGFYERAKGWFYRLD